MEGLLGWAYGLAGRVEDARQVLDQLKRQEAQGRTSALALAWVYVGLGKHDPAIEWLIKADDEREALCAYFRVGANYDPLRSDPRFQALLQRMHFPAGA